MNMSSTIGLSDQLHYYVLSMLILVHIGKEFTLSLGEFFEFGGILFFDLCPHVHHFNQVLHHFKPIVDLIHAAIVSIHLNNKVSFNFFLHFGTPKGESFIIYEKLVYYM